MKKAVSKSLHRPARWCRHVVQGPAQKDEDPPTALLDCAADRDVVDHSAVDEDLSVDVHRRKQGRQCRGGENRVGDRSAREPLGASVGQRGGDHFETDSGILEMLEPGTDAR